MAHAYNHRWIYPTGQGGDSFVHRRCRVCALTQTATLAVPTGPHGWLTENQREVRAWRYEGGPDGSRWEYVLLTSAGTTPPCPGTEYLAPADPHPPTWVFHREWQSFEVLPAVCPNCRVVIDHKAGTATGRISTRMAWGEPGGTYRKADGEEFWVSTRCNVCQLAGMRPVGPAEAVYRMGGMMALQVFLWPTR